jgi:hypothetical protein
MSVPPPALFVPASVASVGTTVSGTVGLVDPTESGTVGLVDPTESGFGSVLHKFLSHFRHLAVPIHCSFIVLQSSGCPGLSGRAQSILERQPVNKNVKGVLSTIRKRRVSLTCSLRVHAFGKNANLFLIYTFELQRVVFRVRAIFHRKIRIKSLVAFQS